MGLESVIARHKLGRSTATAAVAVAVCLAALTGAASPALGHARPAAAAGTISTVAGGLGGPAKAATVGVSVCGVSSAGGRLYLAPGGSSGDVIWRESVTGQLAPVAGTGIPFVVGDLPSHGLPGPVASTWVDSCYAALDGNGNLLLTTADNSIRPGKPEEILVTPHQGGTFYGKAMKTGFLYDIAGSGAQGPGASGVSATKTPLSDPVSMVSDANGNLVIADAGFRQHHGPSYASEIRVVAVKTGTFYGQPMTAGDIYTVAGFRAGHGASGDGGPATKAALGGDIGNVQLDHDGNLVLADLASSMIRVVAVKTGTFYGQPMTAGDIYDVAGDGTYGYAGDGGPAARAELGEPGGVTVDASGNLVIADTGNSRLRVVAVRTGTFYGQAMTAGDIYTVAGDGMAGFSGDGGPAAQAEFSNLHSVAVDASGNLAAADTGNNRLRVVAVKTGTFYGQAMTAGDVYTVAGNGTPWFSGDGGPATRALLQNPFCVGQDAWGNTVICDLNNERIRVVAKASGTYYGQPMTAGGIYTVAGDGIQGDTGDGGPATGAELFSPESVASDSHGNLAIADAENGFVRLVAVKTGTFYGQAMTAGDIYRVAGGGSALGNGGLATSARIGPGALAVDGNGNLVICDGGNDRLRVVAVRTGTFYGQAMTADHIYTVAGDGTYAYTGDGGPATKAGLMLGGPGGLAIDGHGNLVMSDTGDQRIRVVAVRTGMFYGQAMTAGDIYTVAGDGTPGFSGDGGPATSAQLDGPQTVAVDAAGNLAILDQGNDRVRMVAGATGTYYGVPMTAGSIYTVTGNGKTGFAGDGGPATKAELDYPDGLAVTPSGDLLTSEFVNNRIRMVTGGPAGTDLG